MGSPRTAQGRAPCAADPALGARALAWAIEEWNTRLPGLSGEERAFDGVEDAGETDSDPKRRMARAKRAHARLHARLKALALLVAAHPYEPEALDAALDAVERQRAEESAARSGRPFAGDASMRIAADGRLRLNENLGESPYTERRLCQALAEGYVLRCSWGASVVRQTHGGPVFDATAQEPSRVEDSISPRRMEGDGAISSPPKPRQRLLKRTPA